MATNKATTTKTKAPAVKKPTTVTTTTVKTVPAGFGRQSFSQHVESSIQSRTLWRALAAEFIGTFLLASVYLAGQGQPIFVLFALAGVVLLVGAVSGSHVNPALTVAAWVTRRIGWLRAVAYIFAQFLGAAVAFFVLSAFLGGAAQPTELQQQYGQAAPKLFEAVDIGTLAGKEWLVFFAELLGTAILGFAFASALKARDTLTRAFTTGFGIFIALMTTATIGSFLAASTALNPAVALSLNAYDPSVWSYAIFALAPVLGGIVGFIIADLLNGKEV